MTMEFVSTRLKQLATGTIASNLTSVGVGDLDLDIEWCKTSETC